jgi:isoaspartyl peptidase/L-asparaginase-like protein (Ntn-hydrolase superfamily)
MVFSIALHGVAGPGQAAPGGDGGLIVIDRHGRIVMPFSSQGMKRTVASGGAAPFVHVFEPGEV